MISPQVRYAAKALAHLAAAQGRVVPVRELARRSRVPAAYLSKIVNVLGRRGLVRTRRGVGGGVAAVRPRRLGALTLHDLCVALKDPAVERRCFLGEEACSDERACAAHAFWGPQRERMARFLHNTTVCEVARFECLSLRAESEVR